MKLKIRGGYNVPLAGRPAADIEPLPVPDALHLPLAGPAFAYTEAAVADGAAVQAGQVLARDAARAQRPLLAPMGGTVRTGAIEGHLTLEKVAGVPPDPRPTQTPPRQTLVELGGWAYVTNALTGGVPDPAADPQAVIVSTARLEPFGARGDALLFGNLAAFAEGLERLQHLLAYQPIYLLMPDVQSDLAAELRETLRGHAAVQVVLVPLRYPWGDPRLAAREMGLKSGAGPAWALETEGVLALARVLGEGLPVVRRVVALGGPAAARPRHVEAPAGYPLTELLAAEAGDGPARPIAGGALTGRVLGPGDAGLPPDVAGLTLLPEMTEEQLLGWVRPGWNRQSFSATFLSVLRRPFGEAIPAALRGERRACIACGSCEAVCPVRLLPQVIHKALYQDDLDEAERLGVDDCVGCGLCAYVCPSKLELRQEMLDAQAALQEERRHAAEQAAVAEAAGEAGA